MTVQSVLDLLTAAVRKLGAIQQGQTMNGSESSTNFLQLNGLMDELNAERKNLFFIPEQTFALVTGQQSYTIGPGGLFNVPRPLEIQAAAVTVNQFRFDLDLLTENEWNVLTERGRISAKADALYYDRNFPTGTIYVYPLPGAGSNQTLSLSVWSPLPTFAALTDSVNLPPAYWDALVYSLAVRIAPEYGAVVDQSLVLALDSMARQKMQMLNLQDTVPGIQQKTSATMGMPQAAPPSAGPQG